MKKGAIHLEIDCTFRGTLVKFLETKLTCNYSALAEIDGEKGVRAVRMNRTHTLFAPIFTRG